MDEQLHQTQSAELPRSPPRIIAHAHGRTAAVARSQALVLIDQHHDLSIALDCSIVPSRTNAEATTSRISARGTVASERTRARQRCRLWARTNCAESFRRGDRSRVPTRLLHLGRSRRPFGSAQTSAFEPSVACSPLAGSLRYASRVGLRLPSTSWPMCGWLMTMRPRRGGGLNVGWFQSTRRCGTSAITGEASKTRLALHANAWR